MTMRDKFEIFDMNFQLLNSLINKNLFLNCHSTCNDLTRYSAMSNYTDGVVISEILEGIFLDLYNTFNKHEIPDEEKNTLTSELRDGINCIRTSYKDDDKNSLYHGLEKIRNHATHFQIRCSNSFPNKLIRRKFGEVM